MSKRHSKVLSAVLVAVFLMINFIFNYPVSAQTNIPQVQFADAPVTQYTVGDRIRFNIYSPNYGGRVEYRVILWNDSRKTYYDLWNAGNGHPTNYYANWHPGGNTIFTLGWPIFEPGSYRITVCVKREGIANSKTSLQGMNCDSYINSVAFYVGTKEVTIESIAPIDDIMVNQGSVPTLPATVKAIMSNGTEKYLKVEWKPVDTTSMGTYTIEGNVEGTAKKAVVRVIINQGTLNVESVDAFNNTQVDVILRNNIDFLPSTGRFSLKDTDRTNIKINTLSLSSDKKIIQLSTGYMLPGHNYILTVDGREYRFKVPGTAGGTGYDYTVEVDGKNLTVVVGETVDADVSVYPRDAVLRFSSYDGNIAAVNEYTGRIKGISPGTATIIVSGSKQGYETGYETFSVKVYSADVKQIPDIEEVVNVGDEFALPEKVTALMSNGEHQFVEVKGWSPSKVDTSTPGVYTFKGTAYGYSGNFNLTLKVGTKVWLKDKSLSSTRYYFNQWGGPFEIKLERTTDRRRIITFTNLWATKCNSQSEINNYGNVKFTETGYKTNKFIASNWLDTFTMDEYEAGPEHSIRLTNFDDVELRFMNPLDECSEEIQDWFLE